MVTPSMQPKDEENAPLPPAQQKGEVSQNGSRQKGRPKGLSPKGAATRERLFDAAISLMDRDGFAGTTLRDIAGEAGVTHALLYRHFPSKPAVVAALYGRLSVSLAEGAALPKGRWRPRAEAAIAASLDVLRPHRTALASATSVLVGDPDWNVFAPGTADARDRVQGLFREAVSGASDAPKVLRSDALGRLLYLLHLGLIMVWLLDRSKDQRGTTAVLKLVGPGLTLASAALKLPGAWRLVERVDAATAEALYPTT